MGTVGLSFGSPTSGTGFDVTSTVNSIVSNLRNVESPWKNQLTTLQSQDTVLSNLGTLVSKLSTDLGQLTDFEGVLAQKTGSSSNTNVLELSSATSSAVAGTHTIAVNELAKTSSGYLDPISNASDTLAGSISIQVGSGTAHKFDLANLESDSQNLSGLANAINSADIGVTASVLTDAAGSRLSLVSGTSGSKGQLTVTSSITDQAAKSGTNTTGTLQYNHPVDGKDASLTIDGVNLASASNTVSNLIPGVTFQLLAPSSSDSPVQIIIGNYTSGAESAMSSLVSDYNALINAMKAQEGNSSSGAAQPLFGSPTLSLLQQQMLGGINTSNPSGSLMGVKSDSDVLTGSLTIQVGTNNAQTISLGASGETLSSVAAAVNEANLGVTAQVVSDSSGSRLQFVAQTAGSSGTVTINSSVVDTTSNESLTYAPIHSDIQTLGALGISVNNDGTLTLDSATLDSVLNSDFQSVVGFFQDAGSWGKTFATILSNAGDQSTSGSLKLAEQANSTLEANINKSITREEALISTQQKNLTAELTKANQILQGLPSQLDSINMIYSAITGYNPKSS